jgi:hypothetical protein
MLKQVEGLLVQIVTGRSRPDWTLLSVSYLISGAVVLAMRSMFGASG